ncbi:MAG: hypothetical protein ACM3JI_04205 [Anaerolineae bacterium]
MLSSAIVTQFSVRLNHILHSIQDSQHNEMKATVTHVKSLLERMQIGYNWQATTTAVFAGAQGVTQIATGTFLSDKFAKVGEGVAHLFSAANSTSQAYLGGKTTVERSNFEFYQQHVLQERQSAKEKTNRSKDEASEHSRKLLELEREQFRIK